MPEYRQNKVGENEESRKLELDLTLSSRSVEMDRKLDEFKPQFQYFLGVLLVSILCLVNVSDGKSYDEICSSPECYQAGDIIKLNRKPGAKPCGDFYEFACGGWQARNPKSPHQTKWNQFSSITNITKYRIKGILEKEDKREDLESIKAARKFYRSCLHTHENAHHNLQIFLEDLSEWGGWPMISKKWEEEKFNWQHLLTNLERTSFDYSSLLSLIMEPDAKNPSKLAITIDQATQPFCPYIYTEDQRGAFAKLIIATAFEFAMVDKRTLSLEHLVEDTRNVLNFTVEMCALKTLTAEQRDEFQVYNSKTIRELQNITDAIGVQNTYSKINWLQLFDNYLQGSNVVVNERKIVIVQNIDYILQLIQIIDATPQRVLANYMLFHKIANMQKYLSTKMLGIVNKFDHEISGQTAENQVWWQDCIGDARNIFDHAVGYEYVKLYFHERDKEKTTEVFELILDSFIEDLKNSNWMDEETKLKAVEKAHNILPVIGYPEWYKNASRVDVIYSEVDVVDKPYFKNLQNAALGALFYQAKLLPQVLERTSIVLGPAMINAAYFDELNIIYIPAGIIQAPFYVNGRPEALNYGAIGAVIGHELNHAVDIYGRTRYKNGNLMNWWTNNTLKKYLKKEKCFENQYNDYRVPELRTEEEVTHLNGEATVSEDMADNGGLQVAFQAYKKYVSLHGREKRLPELKKYTPEQLFFIGYSTIWCEAREDELILQHILTDDHTPFKYRVLVSLSNSAEFSKAWDCEEGSKMNPLKKCHLWE